MTRSVRGSYILLMELPEEQRITVGRWKTIHFPSSHYAYVGSAMSGIESRLKRHLRPDKKLHWHIDYLLRKASIKDIVICKTGDRVECTIAQALDSNLDCIPGFGCGDCKCHSHLFFSAEGMKPKVMAILNSLGMKPKLMQNSNQEAVAG